jgi:hypothetical protein
MAKRTSKKKTVTEAAEAALTDALTIGQSTSIDGVSVSRTGSRDAYAILEAERKRKAVGNRPLFRGISLGGMQ